MLGRKCPRADELEAMAMGRSTTSGLRRHVQSCPTCAPIVANLERDAQLLTELREAAASALDHETREQVIDVCRGAVKRTDA